MPETETRVKAQHPPGLAEKLAAVGWGAFFIWVGIGFLTNVGWGVGLLGVGAIVIGGEAARKYFGFPVNWFWLTIGSLFVVWGACELLKIEFRSALVPILSIVVGVAILVSALRPRRNH